MYMYNYYYKCGQSFVNSIIICEHVCYQIHPTALRFIIGHYIIKLMLSLRWNRIQFQSKNKTLKKDRDLQTHDVTL